MIRIDWMRSLSRLYPWNYCSVGKLVHPRTPRNEVLLIRSDLHPQTQLIIMHGLGIEMKKCRIVIRLYMLHGIKG